MTDTLDIERLSPADRQDVLLAIRFCRSQLGSDPVWAPWVRDPGAPDNSDLRRIEHGMDLLEPIITKLVAIGDQWEAEEDGRPHANRRRCERCLRSVERAEWESYRGCPSCGHTEWVAAN